MKTFYIITLLFISIISQAQIANIPDTNFKNALIGQGVDTNNDGEIQISEAEVVTSLLLLEQNIADFEGLQYFVNLEVLWASSNPINNIDVTQNYNLTWLTLNFCQLSNLDVSQNTLLETLWCQHNNLSSLDLSQNINLKEFNCAKNQLSNLNIKNGNNNLITSFTASINPNLTCIQVDDVEYSNNNPSWFKDETAIYSEDCNLGINDALATQITIYPNPVKDVLTINNDNGFTINTLKIYNVLGKQVLMQDKPTYQLDVSKLESGLYFISLSTDKGNLIKKMIKK